MRAEVKWILIAATSLTLGAVGGDHYARLTIAYYRTVIGVLAHGRPWKMDSISIQPGDSLGTVIKVVATVHRSSGEARPNATAVGHLQVGAVVQTPVVFWTMLLCFPAKRRRQRLVLLLVAIPVFAILEAATTGVQLIHVLPSITNLLDGKGPSKTGWDYWAEFLEDGGRIAVDVFSALLVVALSEPLLDILIRNGATRPARLQQVRCEANPTRQSR